MIRRCTQCKEPLKGHNGPWGPRCAGRPLISFEAEPEKSDEEVWVEMEEEELVKESENEKSGAETNEAPGSISPKARHYKLFRESRLQSTIRGESGDEAETPGRKYNRDSDALIQQLVSQMDKMKDRMDAISEAQAKANHSVPAPVAATSSQYIQQAAVAGFEDARKVAIDQDGVQLAGGAQPQRAETLTGRPKKMQYLKPVPEIIDWESLDILPEFQDQATRKALRGEFLPLETVLINVHSGTEDIKLETYLENGQLLVKSRKTRRRVVDILSWLEAFNTYENLMCQFHGVEVYMIMSSYKNIMIDWARKYQWYYINCFDISNRSQKSGKSLDFADYSMVLFSSTFHAGTLLKSGNTGCFKCGKPDHVRANCPFRESGGASYTSNRNTASKGASSSQEICYNFNQNRCSYKWCSRAHVCVGCGSKISLEDCKKFGRCSAGASSGASTQPAKSWH